MSLYLTAILPPTALSEEIDDIRKEISARFNVFSALKPPVHITLFRPLNVETSLEKHLIKWLKPITLLHKPFAIELENFDSFNNKTLFVHCIKNPLLQALQKDISGIFNTNKVCREELSGNNRFHPHITVAFRDVKPEVFDQLWLEFKNRKLKRSFIADRVSLLKHDGRKWNLMTEFILQKGDELRLFE
ncbi:2'-5' RNA ligase family protein [Desertivirga xinjiangensis]|uniref:2'-5' RNA ligase family protein n=1 Tax=Desertivirga xinjiangensis TaxID=539206 RepID=UPI0021099AFE|nr:2'-5' RNA ligase family protein [Pedobacter xinjiangensis]